MIKVVKDFLPQTLFKFMKDYVEDEKVSWKWQDNSTYHKDTATVKADGKFKFGKTIYTHPALNPDNKEFINEKYMSIFGVFVDFQNEHQSHKTEHLIKMKLNLYPNEGKQVQHGTHKDIYSAHIPLSPKHMTRMGEDVLDKTTLTSVFNFHTCNGYNCIGKEKIPSVANQIVIFNQTEHYGVTQSDISRRIVFNMNVSVNEKTNK